MSSLYIIPTIISEKGINSIPVSTITVMHKLEYFVVERIRTARRFISSTSPITSISDLNFIEIAKHDKSHLTRAEAWFEKGYEIGLISESGMPGIADPGNDLVLAAHKRHYKVIPLSGPSSITLALAASGLNGQSFAFGGYLPIKENELRSRLVELEKLILRTGQTQIFIETPYRNDRLLGFFTKYFDPSLILCIATDINGEHEAVQTKSIYEWRKKAHEIGKLPSIFIIGKA